MRVLVHNRSGEALEFVNERGIVKHVPPRTSIKAFLQPTEVNRLNILKQTQISTITDTTARVMGKHVTRDVFEAIALQDAKLDKILDEIENLKKLIANLNLSGIDMSAFSDMMKNQMFGKNGPIYNLKAEEADSDKKKKILKKVADDNVELRKAIGETNE
tara:strand:- start:594 stop:1073 length:480 start_codon:yes stop_codon:yes gene_type:complete